MSRLPAVPRWLVLALLFAGAAVLSSLTILDGVQPNDEGLMLQAARRIAGGQVPYRDFWWYYPPGQPYLLAALWKLFGSSLLEWRVLRVASDAAVATLAYALARRRAPVGPALAAWLAAACAMAFPTGPHPFPIALALALAALLAFTRRPVLAGVLAGACAAWRIEFAGYLALAVAAGYALEPGAPRERLARFARFAGAGAAVGLALFAPVVASAGLGRSWDLLVRYPLVDFSRYQSLPFPTHYTGPLNTSSPGGFLSDSAENLVHFYLPLALLIGLVGCLVALGTRLRRDDPAPVAAAVFALGMAHYMLVRTDLFHTAPLAVAVSVLAAWSLALPRARTAWAATWRRTLGGAGAALAALGLAWALVEGVDRRVRGLGEHTVELQLPVADGVRARPARAAPLVLAADWVRAHVPPGAPIYVTGARADLVTSGYPLFYVLVDRSNPTRYDIAAPGVITSARVQGEIVRDLKRARPRVILRWAAPVTALPEPSPAGRSSGVTILDRYIDGDYRLARRFGYYLLLVPRGA